MKPSARIKEIALELAKFPARNWSSPENEDYLNALIQYLDEEYEKTLNS